MTVSSWLDGYLEARRRAFANRGAIELDDGTRWPRTTGTQVAAIAATFTPAIRANASERVRRRWRTTLDDIARDASPTLDETYANNRSFWGTLEAVAVYLDNLALRPPSANVWETLFAIIDTNGGARNVGPKSDGPFRHFDGVKTFDDLYQAEFDYLRDLRGVDMMKPDSGRSGWERPIPRTTNADVIALADYWTPQLANARKLMGTESVTEFWRSAKTDVDQLARTASDPNAVYAKNNNFWRALANTAIHVAAVDEAPTDAQLAKDAIKHGLQNLPKTLGTIASAGGGLVADAANASGRAVGAVGKGLFSGFGAPLLLGAGVVGAFFLLRNGRREEVRHE
ncbi:MAG: hypothetical protein QM831_21950 [Kofleriaceae bacterium]